MSIQTLGDLIQVKRYEKQITLRQLAEEMGIAPAAVRAWETGTDLPDNRQIAMLTTLLRIDCQFLQGTG
jgi:transcriptional regulator with XRE-family HTH domain